MIETTQTTSQPNDETVLSEIITQFHNYARARISFLSQLKRDSSCRDPLAEFSEALVALLLQATMAGSRVQKGYDVIRPNGRHVQVKYLANPSTRWINWHHIQFPSGVEDYALTVFVAMQLKAVLVFPRETIGKTCKLLGKRHPDQDASLQITERNYEAILAEPSKFRALGIEIFDFA